MGTIKKRVKRRLPLVFIFLFLLVGIAIFIYPKVSNWLSVYTSRVEIGSYNDAVKKMDTSQIEALEKKAKDYNEALAKKDTQALSVINYEALLTVTDAIGYIDIPKINIYLPIFHDMSDEVLQKGVGHMEGTSLPVGGKSTHAVLPAHTGLPSAELFTDLDKMELGDVFYIHVLGKVLAYKVDQIKVVLPEDDSDIQIIEGEDYVTLLTCTPYGINDHRLLVRGTRIPYEEKSKEITATPPTQNDDKEQLPVEVIATIAAIIVATIVIAIILLILFLPVGKKSKNKEKASKEKQKS
ncbi:class C sortase [Candidatus Pseudoruminococcus sp.]|uniref:class C sortase n=1 Tax=Candidatus Pseudoruminococcus sp. TaxID=3101048 RepID=UPI00399AF5CD